MGDKAYSGGKYATQMENRRDVRIVSNLGLYHCLYAAKTEATGERGL